MEEEIKTGQAVEVPADSQVEVVDIQFRPGQKIYFFDPDGAIFEAGDHVIIDTARGAEFGICAGGNPCEGCGGTAAEGDPPGNCPG